MSYFEQWRAISARIRALVNGAHLYAEFQQSNTADSYGAGKYLGEQCNSVLTSVGEFARTYEATLPPDALTALKVFLEGHPGKVIGNIDSAREARASLIFLAGLESEISFLLTNRQELIRARSERAFLHLQRLLVVDAEVRAKWKTAFEGGGEVSCEALGSVHLLAHGIYAFKINAAGARTDLVYNEPIDALPDERAVEGLVLTEWKSADAKNEAGRFQEARKQTELYKQGPLASSELRAYRYLIAVSLSDLPTGAIPADVILDGVTYRHINIAIESRFPSKRAKQA